MRTGLFFLCCLVQFAVVAQRSDSVMLQSVTVYGLPDDKYLAGSSVHALDSALLSTEKSHHLGEVLSLQFPVYFRNYGNGMLSGISMRGTSPQHTAVLWNGININSFSLGQADFSILPASAFDEIKVHEGGASARFGSGAFGGTVLLNSKLPSSSMFSLTQDAGSFGRYFTSLSGTVRIERWSFQTRLYTLDLKNNFRILRTGERQQHAAVTQSGVLQDISYQLNAASAISIHYWFNYTDRDIQPGIGQYNSTDTQQDINHRLSIRYATIGLHGVHSVYGGYVNDGIVFNGGKSTVARVIGGVREEYRLGEFTNLQAGAEWNHISGRIPDYNNGKAVEDRFDFTAAVQRSIGNRLSLALNLRQPVVSGFSAPFLPYLGVDYLIIRRDNSALKLRGSISKNYRIPTLNDRYWQNLGDKNLLPETTHAGEAGAVWTHRQMEFSVTGFAQKVDQWIQWVPGDNGIYRPHNIKQVLAEGIESKFALPFQFGGIKISPQISYQYTRSVTTRAPVSQSYTIGKQLIYTPANTGSLLVQVSWKSWSSLIATQYSGPRFTDTGNALAYALSAYATINVTAGRRFIVRKNRFDLQFSVRNLLNTDYQLYSGFALPGRNYNLQFVYQFNFNSISK